MSLLTRRRALGSLVGLSAALTAGQALAQPAVVEPAPTLEPPARAVNREDVRRWLADQVGDDVGAQLLGLVDWHAGIAQTEPTAPLVDGPIPLTLAAPPVPHHPYLGGAEWSFRAEGVGVLTGCRWRGWSVKAESTRINLRPGDLVSVSTMPGNGWRKGDAVVARVGDRYELRRARRANEAGVIGRVDSLAPRRRSVTFTRPGPAVVEAL